MLRIYATCAVILLSGCATAFESPRNLSTTAYQSQRQPMSGHNERAEATMAAFQNASRCEDTDLATIPVDPSALILPAFEVQTDLSPGDLIRVDIVRGEGFSGDYIVSAQGYVTIPHLGDLPAAGYPAEALETTISRLLVEGAFFRSNFVQVGVSVLHWAPIQVQVAGAVFSSGDVILNERLSADDREERIQASGDFTVNRTLSAALRSAAGVRPDADIRNIVLIRKGRRQIFDMIGTLDGSPLEDPLLVAGDRIYVPSRKCFQMTLARPSRITPPGIRVFMSNLTRPAASNANSAIGRDATNLPYGTRLLQGLVSANCVGGIQATNAGRWAVLISRNPITGESEVISRSIEDMVRRADRDDFNPVLLPGDAIACYDSHMTNARDVVATIAETVSPLIGAAVLGGVAR